MNIHYGATLAGCVPATVTSVLDVGCGDGFLAARLARRVPHVVALDIDEPVLARARARFPDAAVLWRHGDILADSFAPGSFDAVVSNATLHHLPDTESALRHLGALVRPGGTVAIVTFPRAQWRDWLWVGLSFVSCAVVNRVRGKWEPPRPRRGRRRTPSGSCITTPAPPFPELASRAC